jgi:hypothetical protein
MVPSPTGLYRAALVGLGGVFAKSGEILDELRPARGSQRSSVGFVSDERNVMQKLFTLSLALAAAVALSISGTASAGGGGSEPTIKSGSCSGAANWKLKAKLDDGRIETEFEVDQNRIGKRWRVKIRRNGVLAFDGIRVTLAPSGSFEVRRRLRNAAGPDRIVATAIALATGQTCRGVVTL